LHIYKNIILVVIAAGQILQDFHDNQDKRMVLFSLFVARVYLYILFLYVVCYLTWHVCICRILA